MKTALATLIALALSACAPTPAPPAETAGAASVPAAPAAAAAATAAAPASSTAPDESGDARESTELAAYHWQLADAKGADGSRIDALFARADRPLQLDFGPHALAVTNTCNRLRGTWSLEGATLALGPFASTLMACNDSRLDALDAAAGQYLSGKLAFALHPGDAAPTLQLTTAAADTLTFTGVPTAETRYRGAGERIFLEVAAAPAQCPPGSAAATPCLTVRDVHYGADGVRSGEPGPWRIFTQPIEGYAHDPGVDQVLRLKRFALQDTPAAASSAAYVLDLVVESRRAAPDGSTDRP